jgi:hypothetical protein
MAKSYRKRSRRQRGGTGNAPNPSSYSSATTYGMEVNGNGNSQFHRVFNQNGPDTGTQSNTIVGVQGQNLGYSPSTTQKAGRRRKKRGGFWGSIVNQAVVPFGILGMQQTYRRKKYGGAKSRRHRRH